MFLECGGSLSGGEGIIVHPNHPDLYLNDQNCQYLITVSSNKVVQISIIKLDLEFSTNCDYDYIELYDNLNGRKMKYCKPGSYQDFFSSGRSLVIRFYTDESTRKGGFRLKWKAINPENVKTDIVTKTTPAISTTEATTVEKISTTIDGSKAETKPFDPGMLLWRLSQGLFLLVLFNKILTFDFYTYQKTFVNSLGAHQKRFKLIFF